MTRRRTGSVRHAEVHDFARLDEVIEAKHDLLDGRRIIPPVHVEEVDIARPKLLQRVLYLSRRSASGLSIRLQSAKKAGSHREEEVFR
jgi:hypothetical protein